MKMIGRRTKANIAANRILKKKFAELGIERCEVKLPGCMPNFAIGFAHWHKRIWYYDWPELLSDINEVVLACPNCHAKMEPDKELTEEVFNRLRPIKNGK